MKGVVFEVVVRHEPIPPWVFGSINEHHFRDLAKLRRAMLPILRSHHKNLPLGVGPDELIKALDRFGFLSVDRIGLWVSMERLPFAKIRKATFWRELTVGA